MLRKGGLHTENRLPDGSRPEAFSSVIATPGSDQGRLRAAVAARRPGRAARRGARRLLGGGDALAVERDEVDRVDVERREAAVAHRFRDDLAGERGRAGAGHSIITTGWSCSLGTFCTRKTPA